MTPGPPRLLKCPYCGEDKELMSLNSGNTFRSTSWSDTYRYAPMMPSLSPVQKCPHCGDYFMLPNEKPRFKEVESSFDYSFETGKLTFPEIKEAVNRLQNSGLNKDQEIALRFETVYRFNDAFREFGNEAGREEDKKPIERTEMDWQFHRDNLLRLITLLDKENDNYIPVIAEFYREAGRFEESISLIDSFTPNSDFIKKVMEKIKEKAIAKEDKIFVLN